MEDTLRYFFSAIFQGIAAILTLGAMFYMNFAEKTKSKISELEKRAYGLYTPGDAKLLEKILLTNVIEVMKEHYLSLHVGDERYNYHRQIVKEYENATSKLNEIKDLLPSLIIEGAILLIFSSVSLFLVGYSENLNLSLFAIGILIILITFSFIMTLLSIIIVSTDLEGFKYLKLLFVKKSKDKTLE